MVDINTRNEIRTNILDTLFSAFPKARRVDGGIAFLTDTLDESTGLYVPVEIKIAVKNTSPTATTEAYDIERAVAEYEIKSTKARERKSDPEKAAERAAKKEAATLRSEEHKSVIMNYAKTFGIDGMTCSQIKEAIPQFAEVIVMNVGATLKKLVEENKLTVELDENRKKIYFYRPEV